MHTTRHRKFQTFTLFSYLKQLMQNKDLSRWQRKLMLGGLLLFICAWYAAAEEYKHVSTMQVLKDLGTMLGMALALWLLTRWVMSIFRKKFPHYSQTFKRIILTLTTSGVLGMLATTVLYGIPQFFLERRFVSFAQLSHNFGPSFFFSALIIGAHEVMLNHFELRKIDQEREELKKAHLQSQLDSLKSQVNPHFLFNSLNTVLSLIATSPKNAEQFVLELSSVYRYLLQANENQLTTLQEEMQFTKSYFHLLKTRFGDAIRLKQEIDEDALHQQVPSLTLQLLIENAVKHNVVSNTKPLTITIRTYRESQTSEFLLIVQNNLQRKTQQIASGGMGLNNILSKFRLLNQNDVIITDKDNHFTVVLPLLKTNVHEIVGNRG